VKPTLFWASGAWRLMGELCDELVLAQRQMYRQISMHPRRPDDTAWSYYERTARCLDKWLREDTIQRWDVFGLRQDWNWGGHLARLPSTILASKIRSTDGVWWRLACKQLHETTSFKGKFGFRRRLRWENTIEQFCRKEHYDVWLGMAVDKETWEARSLEYARFVHAN